MKCYYKGEIVEESDILNEAKNSDMIGQIMISIEINKTYLQVNPNLTDNDRYWYNEYIKYQEKTIQILEGSVSDNEIIDDNIRSLDILIDLLKTAIIREKTISKLQWTSLWLNMFLNWLEEVHKFKKGEKGLKFGR